MYIRATVNLDNPQFYH